MTQHLRRPRPYDGAGTRRALGAVVTALTLVLGVGACAGEKKSPYAPLQIGDAAPAFEAQTLDGQAVSLASLRGHPVLLNIWATWCAPCRREMPLLDSVARETAPRGVRVIGVSIDDAGAGGDVAAFLKEYGVGFTVLHDPNSTVTALFRTRGVPETFLLDSQGRLAQRWIGGVDARGADIRKAVDEVR